MRHPLLDKNHPGFIGWWWTLEDFVLKLFLIIVPLVVIGVLIILCALTFYSIVVTG